MLESEKDELLQTMMAGMSVIINLWEENERNKRIIEQLSMYINTIDIDDEYREEIENIIRR